MSITRQHKINMAKKNSINAYDRKRPIGHGLHLWLILLIALIISACQQAPEKQALYQKNFLALDCRQFLTNLNQTIAQADLADVQYTKLPDYPHLRVDRFLASLLPAIQQTAEYHFWLEQVAALALDGFGVELKNLNSDNKTRLKAQSCIQVLLEKEKNLFTPGMRLRKQAMVEDNYSSWQRALGLYPVMLIPIAWGINNHQQSIRQVHQEKSGQQLHSATQFQINYQPPLITQTSKLNVAAILKKASDNPLALPVLTARQQQTLLNHFAPILVVANKGPADEIGSLSWSANGGSLVVKPEKATAYTKISYTRYRHQNLLQLNYIFWFPERPLSSLFDLLGGHLDGITWRLTLDSQGKVLMQDTMHNCGCYHMFYPGPQLQQKILPASLAEIAFVPQKTPTLKHGWRSKIHIAHSTHYINRLGSAVINPQDHLPGKTYQLEPYAALRNLPHPTLGFRSMFNDEGLVTGSARRERYLFWPLGIASAGAMRQWGRHATAFIGRRHFDDPDLIEKNFTVPADEKD